MTPRIAREIRYEVKFVAPEALYPHLAQWLLNHTFGFQVVYPARFVNSAYFDTFEYASYRDNLAGLGTRAKVRYRWYGPCAVLGPGRLEVKCKQDGLGWKLVYEVRNGPAESGASWSAIVDVLLAQVPPEARRWLDEYPQPVVVTCYRRAYFGSLDGRVRATLDAHQAVFDQRYDLRPNLTRPANIPCTAVLEVKAARDARHAVEAVVASLPLRPSRHSKYSVGMRAVYQR